MLDDCMRAGSWSLHRPDDTSFYDLVRASPAAHLGQRSGMTPEGGEWKRPLISAAVSGGAWYVAA